MEDIGSIVGRVIENLAMRSGIDLSSLASDTAEDAIDCKIRALNEIQGTLTECKRCNGKTYIYVRRGNYSVFEDCECRPRYLAQQQRAASGLSDLLPRCTLEAFEVKTQYHAQMKAVAEDYLRDPGDRWMYIGGAVGCGKTHICVAVCGELLDRGQSVRFVGWRDDSVTIKACVTDAEEYDRLIRPLKTCDVLYIDDFLKTQRGTPPTPADVNLAFEILSARYNKNLRTILSSEREIDALIGIDEAMGSRIYQRAKECCVQIAPGAGKNYRVSG